MANAGKILREVLGNLKGKPTKDIVQEYNARTRKKSTGPSRDDYDLLKKEFSDGDQPPVTPSDTDVGPPVDPSLPPRGPDTGNPAPPDPDVPQSTPAPPETATEPVSPLEFPDDAELARVKKEYPKEPRPLPDAEKRTDTRNINIQRHHEGASANLEKLNEMDPTVSIEKMETADDIARMLEVNARNWGYTPSHHSALIDATNSRKKVEAILGPVWNGKVNGRLDETQLFAVRRMVATVGQETIDLADKIYVKFGTGDRSPQMLLKLDQKLSILHALQRFLQGEERELGRALSQQRVVAETIRGDNVDAMLELMLANGRTPESLIQNARSIKQRAGKPGSNPAHDALKASQLKWRTRLGAGVDLWKGNVLTGAGTHALNTFSNAVLNMYQNGVVMTTAAVIGTARRRLIPGQEDTSQVYLREQIPVTLASIRGFYDGMGAFGRYLRTGKGDIAGDKAEYTGRISKALQIGAFGKGMSSKAADTTELVLTPAYRLLGAGDEGAKIVAIRQSLARQSERQAIDEGLTGMERAKRQQVLMNDPPDDMMKRAIDDARDVTLTNQNLEGLIGNAANHTRQLVAAHPWLGWLIPFTQTPANLVAKSVDMTALGIISPRIHTLYRNGGADRDVAIAKLTLGLAQTVAVWQMWESGLLTDGGPDDPAQRKFLEDTTNWKPFAIRHGDQYYSLARMDPFALSMAPVLAMLSASKYAAEQITSEAYFKGAIFAIADHSLDKSWLSGISNTITAIGGNEPQQDNLIGNVLSGYVPYSAAVNDIKKFTDPQKRRLSRDPKTENWKGLYYHTKQRLNQRVPGWPGMSLRPARLWDGNLKMPEAGPPMWRLSPVAKSTVKDMDAASGELWENEVIPREPPRSVTVDDAEVSLLELDNGAAWIYDAYVVRVGRYRRQAVEDLLRDREHTKLPKGPGGERAIALRAALTNARADAQDDFFRLDLKKISRELAQEDPDTYNHLVGIFGNEDKLDRFIARAQRRGRVPEEFKGKVKIRGNIDADAFPLPKGVEIDRKITGPRF